MMRIVGSTLSPQAPGSGVVGKRGRHRLTGTQESELELHEDIVEYVAREIQVRGLTGPAVMFLEASRPYHPLGGQAMLFFHPVMRELFGGDLAEMQRVLADEAGIELLIERLSEMDEESGYDA